ncbi:MAG: tetratricopeptide repeat protein [Bacteroidota bacterium]
MTIFKHQSVPVRPLVSVFCLLLMMLVLGSTAAYGQIETAVQAFDAGNESYRTGDYADALAAYEEALAGGYTSGALFYNMGNAHYRLDQLGEAVLYYEKARLLTPENAELLHNLEIINTKTVDQFTQLPVPAWVSWWQTMLAKNGGRWLFWVGMLFYLLAVGVIIYRMRMGALNPWIRRLRAVTILLGCVFLFAAFAASMQSVEASRAVIMAERVDVKAQPDPEGITEVAIHEGLVVDILQYSEEWIEVRLPNGARGWVPANVAETI